MVSYRANAVWNIHIIHHAYHLSCDGIFLAMRCQISLFGVLPARIRSAESAEDAENVEVA